MSTVKELADAEADQVEAELGTDDPDPDDVTDTPAASEPEQPVADPKTDKAMERVLTTYFGGLKRVLGDAMDDLHGCPTCAETLPGFVLELPQPYDEYKKARDKITCPDCDGYGQVLSGAKNANTLVMCMTCTGNGYVSHAQPQAPQYGNPDYGASSVPPGYLPSRSEDTPMRDQWGRPLGHPHFGTDPSQIGA